MTVYTGAGTTLALSPPPTLSGDYSSLVFNEVGEVGELGDVVSLTYEAVSWRTVKSPGERKIKGGSSIAAQTVTVGIDRADAGQALVDNATGSNDPYFVRISHPQFGVIFGQAFVMGGMAAYGDMSAVATRNITFEYAEVSFLPLGGNPATLVISENTIVLS